ncbi:IS66 family insertion sequence element accessory protein TnpB [Myxococcus qinghaiensis]|uniref:IS66 family insertion sequence element accessory protein TnpB n=1 Tax=Myxococcus qinghaiensis TaxID=2906758 RepID=UPI0020A72F97|nr:IS66 family insertion sequence element accessory protein TnpB [Myxococcus qinghaiensis]MCP3170258.1 IS66 family insertion sequence element accessory protein TnpB [Myxococcus qinghaiensis]
MIGSTRRLSVYAYGQPCDMRKSFDTLAALVTGHMRRDLLSGDVFLFVGRSRRRAKALFFDGTGLCLFAKRLERGRFAALWKREAQDVAVQLAHSELALFFEGSELVGRAPASVGPLPLFALARGEHTRFEDDGVRSASTVR